MGERGAIFTFNPFTESEPNVILVRVGVSFISTDQACQTAEEEIPDFDFERVAREAQNEWDKVLGRVEVAVAEGQNDTRELLYSSVSTAMPGLNAWF